jgi:hypothetical protein
MHVPLGDSRRDTQVHDAFEISASNDKLVPAQRHVLWELCTDSKTQHL